MFSWDYPPNMIKTETTLGHQQVVNEGVAAPFRFSGDPHTYRNRWGTIRALRSLWLPTIFGVRGVAYIYIYMFVTPSLENMLKIMFFVGKPFRVTLVLTVDVFTILKFWKSWGLAGLVSQVGIIPVTKSFQEYTHTHIYIYVYYYNGSYPVRASHYNVYYYNGLFQYIIQWSS